jgi:hypothetical protein
VLLSPAQTAFADFLPGFAKTQVSRPHFVQVRGFRGGFPTTGDIDAAEAAGAVVVVVVVVVAVDDDDDGDNDDDETGYWASALWHRRWR